jgi:hypothetical protein
MLSTTEVIELASRINSCLNGDPVWKNILYNLKGPQYLEPALRALTSKNAGPALIEHFRRYFTRCGPEEWVALAASWDKIQAEDQDTFIALMRANERFGEWLKSRADEKKDAGAAAMYAVYNRETLAGPGHLNGENCRSGGF